MSSEEVTPIPEKFSAEKEKELVEQAELFKDKGNSYFKANRDFKLALAEYENALNVCPNYLSEKIAIYYGNISACYFNLAQYKETVDACTKALDKDPNHIKARLRRANANEKIDTWSSLESSFEDLRLLLSNEESVTGNFRKTVLSHLRIVEPRLEEKKKTEAQEVLGKLKTMGNDLLKNFGLSLDNFNIQQNTDGGYKANFSK